MTATQAEEGKSALAGQPRQNRNIYESMRRNGNLGKR